MIQDDRARALAVEFGGNWLDFRRFEEHNSVDRNRFPEFTNELRQAMFEEPVRFFLSVAQHDQSVLDFLYGDYTFVNPVLAKFYGMPAPNTRANEWTRIDDIGHYGRGGLPTMAVFLTKNAPGLRTSPVKRGYWVVRRLLGEVIPPPPPNVPVLPADETKLGDLTLPQTMAKHREDRNLRFATRNSMPWGWCSRASGRSVSDEKKTWPAGRWKTRRPFPMAAKEPA